VHTNALFTTQTRGDAEPRRCVCPVNFRGCCLNIILAARWRRLSIRSAYEFQSRRGVSAGEPSTGHPLRSDLHLSMGITVVLSLRTSESRSLCAGTDDTRHMPRGLDCTQVVFAMHKLNRIYLTKADWKASTRVDKNHAVVLSRQSSYSCTCSMDMEPSEWLIMPCQETNITVTLL
jgi:hypothetical protein